MLTPLIAVLTLSIAALSSSCFADTDSIPLAVVSPQHSMHLFLLADRCVLGGVAVLRAVVCSFVEIAAAFCAFVVRRLSRLCRLRLSSSLRVHRLSVLTRKCCVWSPWSPCRFALTSLAQQCASLFAETLDVGNLSLLDLVNHLPAGRPSRFLVRVLGWLD